MDTKLEGRLQKIERKLEWRKRRKKGEEYNNERSEEKERRLEIESEKKILKEIEAKIENIRKIYTDRQDKRYGLYWKKSM